MKNKLIKIDSLPTKDLIIVAKPDNNFSQFGFSEAELNYIQKAIENKQKQIVVNQYSRWIFIWTIENNSPLFKIKEKARLAANTLLAEVRKQKLETIALIDADNQPEITLAFAEGLLLGNYQFLKYFTEKVRQEKESSLKTVEVFAEKISKKNLQELENVIDGVCAARTLINEPPVSLTAEILAHEIEKLGKKAGFSTEILDKKHIEALKFGGLLAVNRGSIDPPTFSILEWKPKKPTNAQPIVIVGKGLTFDTGGLSLKPTKNSMDYMKCDMSGGAAVAGLLYALAANKVNVHVIGLVPATDSRPGGNAFAPGDVLTLHNGVTVENLNSDAEGRLILGDALSFAKKYKPQLVFDIATLTGAAAAAVAKHAIVAMGNAEAKIMQDLKDSGESTYERIVEFPLWEEYDDMIKSQIADIKNVGEGDGGAITAGKFLEHFVDYPWIHLDIAGSAFFKSQENYRGNGGSGVTVRLLYDFITTKLV